MKGRTPQPANLKIARGGNPNSINSPQRRTTPTLEKLPKAPPWLGKIGREHWEELGPTLVASGVLSDRDLDAFACYCAAWHRWRMAEDTVALLGPTAEQDGKVYKRPETSMARDALAQVLKYQEHFGMTPASRSRIDTPTGQAVDILTKLRTRREKARNVKPKMAVD